MCQTLSHSATLIFLGLTTLLTSSLSADEFPNYGLMPKREIQALDFLEKHPKLDGRGTVVAVFDTGVDPGASGLKVTSDGKPKIIDIVDGSGSGDVDTSTVVKAEDGKLEGLSGRTLMIPKKWKNPNNEYHLGMKPGYELYPQRVLPRLKAESKKKWDKHYRKQLAKLERDIQNFNAKHPKPDEQKKKRKSELEERVSQFKLANKNWKDPGPIFDCVVFHDGKHWRAAIDTDEDGDFEDEKLMTNFRTEREYGTFNDENLINYVLNIYDDGNLLSVVVDCGTHASHVAGIIAGNYPDQPELNGIAPGAQIVSVKIGDSRIGSSSLGTGELRGLITVLENKCDLINMSYGGASPNPNAGRFAKLYSEIVNDHGVIFVSSAGNDGPALSTVGSPGGTTSAIIGVGAYVSPELMEVSYSLRETIKELPYTWSSRGPTLDGDLGVDICAPGGAIASVSQWALSRNQLMNGTSMSSPNACGGIALLLSGLKSENIEYSPALVKRGVTNSTRALTDSDPFSTGQGLIQVNNAYNWLTKYANTQDSRLRFDVTLPKLEDARGIYLREPNEISDSLATPVSITPVFHEDTPNIVKANFNMEFRLECEANWVNTPDFFFLHHGGRDFEIEVDPTKVPSGANYTEIVGYDNANPKSGPMFRVPITVIKPEHVHDNQWTKKFNFAPGEVHRSFLDIPQNATWADLKISTQDYDSNRLYVFHTLQTLEDHHHKQGGKRTYIRILPNEEKMISFPVTGGRTLELCLAQYWSSLGETQVEFELTLHGISASPNPITIDGSQSVARVDLSGTLGSERIEPSASFDTLRRVIRPSKSETQVLSAERDLLPKQHQVYGLTQTIPFSLSAKADITVESSLMADSYSWSYWSSTLWMIYDKNKQLMGTGTSGKEASLPAGDYTMKMYFRHDDPSKLEAVKDAVVWIDQKLKSKISLSPKSSHQAASNRSGSFSARNLEQGETVPVYFSVPKRSSLPKDAEAGDLLIGKIYYGDKSDGLDGSGQRPDGYQLTMTVVDSPGSKPEDKPSTAKKEKSLDDLLFETKLTHLNKLATEKKTEEFKALSKELLAAKPKNLKVLQASIKLLDGDDRKEHLPELVKACDRIIKLQKTKALASYFGVRRDPESEEEKTTHRQMTEKRDALTDALYRKARAIAYMDLPPDPKAKDAPEIKKHPDTPEKRTELFEKTYDQLKQWVDPTTEKKYALVHIRWLRRNDRQAEALAELTKLIKEEPTNLLYYKKRADIYGELHWNGLQSNENQWRILRKRKDYLPF